MPYRPTALLTGSRSLLQRLVDGAHVVVTSDLTAFLPAAAAAQRLLVEQLRAGVASRTMLVAIEGGAPPELARFSASSRARSHSTGASTNVMNGAAEFTRGARSSD